MVGPVLAQTPKFHPHPQTSTRRRSLPLPTAHYSASPTQSLSRPFAFILLQIPLPATPFFSHPSESPGAWVSASSARSFNPATPVLPITSLQPSQFHAVTLSFAQRRTAISPIINSFHTLSIATGVVPHCTGKYLNVYFNLGHSSLGSAVRPFAACPACSTLFVRAIHICAHSRERH